MIKEVNCLKFVYECLGSKSEIKLESEIQFTVQVPKNESLLERAILVIFRAHGDDDKFKLECICRVVFSFSTPAEVIEGKEFLELYRNDAYDAMKDLMNNCLSSLKQNKLNFPEIEFT